MEQKKISQQAKDCLLKMQQNEITEAAVYRAIAAFTKDDANKQVLLHLAEEEEAHYNIWKSYTGVELKPQKLKVFFRKICAAVLGFTFTIKVPSNHQPHIDTAEVLKEQFKAIGVTAEIQLITWESWLSDVYVGRQFQSTVVGVDAGNMTARALLERFTSTYSKNFINYNNPAYDQLFAQVLEERDDARRTDLYKQMQRQLTETAANVYIQDLANLVAIRENLTGYEFYPMYVMDMSTVRYVD